MNPVWAYALGAEDDDRAWEEGNSAARVLHLRNLRSRDPALARTKLEEVWKNESAQDREAFLEAFLPGLSLEDEPFLERALDDRGKEVRGVAAGLLARMPESALCRRMQARVDPLVTITKKLFKRKMQVKPPDEIEDGARRDGAERTAPIFPKVGEKATWLRGIVASAPLGYWTGKFESSPTYLIDLARQTEWSESMIAGWAWAAIAQGNHEWATALLSGISEIGHTIGTALLMSIRTRAEAEQFLIGGLERGELTPHSINEGWFEAIRVPWSVSLTHAVLKSAMPLLSGSSQYQHGAAQAWTEIARRSCPEIYPEAEVTIRSILEQETQWTNTLNRFLAIYEFRHSMYKEIES